MPLPKPILSSLKKFKPKSCEKTTAANIKHRNNLKKIYLAGDPLYFS